MQKLMHGLRFKGFDLSTKSKIPEKHTTFERPFLRIRTLYFPAAISSNPNASEMQKPMILKHGLKFKTLISKVSICRSKEKSPGSLLLSRGFIHRCSLHNFELVQITRSKFLKKLYYIFPAEPMIRFWNAKTDDLKARTEIQNLDFKCFNLSTKSKIPAKLITF